MNWKRILLYGWLFDLEHLAFFQVGCSSLFGLAVSIPHTHTYNWCNRRVFDIVKKNMFDFFDLILRQSSVRSAQQANIYTKLKRKEKKRRRKTFLPIKLLHFFLLLLSTIRLCMNAIQNYEWFGSMHISRTNIKCICSFVAHMICSFFRFLSHQMFQQQHK